MVKRLMMVFAGALMCSSTVLAQTKVTGTVVSQEDGEPIVGAAVRIDGTNTGTVTDVDGRFSLEVKSGQKLQVTYLGMAPQRVTAGPNLRIVLSPDDKTLNEVVVTALGIKRSEKALGYSATTIKAEDLTKNRNSDVVSSISGTVAGVQVTSTSGDPGASQGIVVRGFTSLSGNNQPLFVIDGVPMNNSAVYSTDGLNQGFDFGNGASALNPDDVETMTVLKGASATALYGSRAANGVVMITTKSGKKQKKGLGVEYNGGLQWSVVGRLPEMQNDFGMGWNAEKTEIENGSWGPRFDGSKQLWGTVYENSQQLKSYRAIEDNVRDFFETGTRYNNSLSLNNANDNGSYFVSLSQVADDGILPTSADSYDKYTFSFRGDYKIKDLTLSTSMNYTSQRNKFAQTGQGLSMVNSIYQSPRDISFQDLKDLSNPFNKPGYYYTPYGVTNPYYILENYIANYKSDRTFGKFELNYKFLNYFDATYRFGLDFTSSEQQIGTPNLKKLFKGTENDIQGVFNSATGSDEETMTRFREINQDFMIHFAKDIASELNLNVIAGMNYNERKNRYQRITVKDLTIPNWINVTNTSSTPKVLTNGYRRRSYSAYASADLAWKDMLFLSLVGRNDWSSTLPKENQSFFYPGVNTGWVFSELLGQDIKKWLSFGKLRIAWGQTGNDADPYLVYPYYALATSDASGWGDVDFPLNGVNSYSRGNTLGSSTLQPEITTEFEVGINLAFLDNRINLDADYYNRNSDKQIFTLNSDPATAYNFQTMNLGKIRNQGIEALLTVKPVVTKDFEWSTSFNFTKNWSKVVSLPESLGGQSNIQGLSGGAGLYAITGMALGQFMAEVPERDPEGHIVVNASTGLPVAASAQEIVGSMNNKYTLGISTNLRYKDFAFGFVIDIREGGLMYSRTKSINYFTGNAIQTTYNERNPFIVPNSVNKIVNDDQTVTYVENTTPISMTDMDDYWNAGGDLMGSSDLISKSFVKLRSVNLSWDLPRQWLNHTFLTGVRLTLFGNNLLCWTPSSNTFIDPESTSFGNDLEGQYGEYSANPSSRKFGFNVQVKF